MSGHPSHDDLYGYALGALDPAEERAVAEHVPNCERCSIELLERINPAVGVLAESVEQRPAPPALRDRVLEIVRAEAADAGDTEPARDRAPRFDLRGFFLRPVAALIALAVLAAGVAGYMAAGDDAGRETVQFSSATAGAGASLEVEGERATLEAHGMPALAKGSVYQVWIQEGSKVRPTAAFVPLPDGTATAAVAEELGGASKVLVSREPSAGRLTPSTVPILTAAIN